MIEACTKERANKKWKLYTLAKVLVFAVLLRQIPMGCKDAVVKEPLAKKQTVNCLTYGQNTRKPYNDNLCPFKNLALHLHGKGGLEKETSKMFTPFKEKDRETNPAGSQGDWMNDISNLGDFVPVKIFLYDIDLVDGGMFEELAGQRVGNLSYTIQLLRYNSHLCYVSKINALFEGCRFPWSDKLIKKAGNVERHLTTCKERVKHKLPGTVYQLRETQFDKVDSLGILLTDNQNLFNKLAIIKFESICLEDEKIKDTETTKKIGKRIPISVSTSSILIQEHFFLCDPNPRDLVSSFIDALQILAKRSKSEINMNFFQIETAIKNILAGIVQTLNQRHSHCVCVEAEDNYSSTQFLKCRKVYPLTRSNILRDIAIHCEFMVSTVGGTISTLSRVTYYLFS